MKKLQPIIAFYNQLTNVPTIDPDDARRRKLLNILLFGIAVLSLLTFITIIVASFFITFKNINDIWFGLGAAGGLLIGTLIFYAINRQQQIPGWVASALFLVFLSIVLCYSDSAEELANGRSVFIFVVPIIMASILLGPASSFLFALLGTFEVIWLANTAQIVANTFATIGFFLVAFISWLSGRNLENAIKEVRILNSDLEKRVEERTQELSESLAREAQQASQRQAILQGIADGVMVFDTQNNVILTNPALIRLLELPLDKVLRRNLNEILETPELSQEHRNQIIRSIGVNESTLAPIRIKWGAKTLSMIAAPVRDTKGQTLGNVAVLRDFTREAEVEEMKNAFVAMVSHELRTPLNAILGYSEMLRDAFYGTVNDKQINAADRIFKNSRRLLDIVSDLLDQAQIEAGRLKFQFVTFETAELTTNLHSVMDKIALDKGLQLITYITPEMPAEIEGDPQRLQQVLVNLTNNAVKFTSQGSIKVNVYRVNEEHWAFDVTDTGRGIALEDQKYIFEPFRQVEGTVTRSQGGIGLGLSIVRRLAELMGGRIFVKSTPGQGSTFTVVLPFQPPK